MWKEAHRNTINKLELNLEELPMPFHNLKIFFISDIHKRKIDSNLIVKVKAETPDLIIIGGDIAEKGVSLKRIEENIKLFVRLAPTYFVWGNNDYEVDYRKLDILLRDNRVTVLDNTATSFEADNKTLVLIGVDDFSVERARIDLAMHDAENGYNILLSHNPDIIDHVKPEYNIKLILSGHTHGGQIRVFGWGLREKGGLKYKKGIPVYISNGYGTTKIPLRLGAPSETNLFILKRK
jgi:uncharacterized protein